MELVDRALASEPGDRFATAAIMRQEVERVAEFVGGLASHADLAAWAQSAYRKESVAPPPLPIPGAQRLEATLKRVAVPALVLVTLLFGLLGLRFLARRGIQPGSEPGRLRPSGSVAAAAGPLVLSASISSTASGTASGATAAVPADSAPGRGITANPPAWAVDSLSP